MKKLRIGIAGVGKLGRYHAQNLLQLQQVELTGVHDIDPERGNRISSEFGVPFFADYDKLLENADAVTIAVPTVSHFELASRALLKQMPVFVEKPIAATVEEAEKLVDLARSAGVPIQVGHIERFNPALEGVGRELLDPRFIEAHRLSSFDPRGTDVAVVLDLMIHDIDLILSFVNSPVKRIDASGVGVVSGNEDIANARIVFENGCVANLTASRISLKKMRKMRIFQKNMYISIDLLLGCAETYSLQELAPEDQPTFPMAWGVIEKDGVRKQISYRKFQAENGNALKAELESFVEAVKNNTKPIVSGEDGLQALKVATKVLEKIKEQNFG